MPAIIGDFKDIVAGVLDGTGGVRLEDIKSIYYGAVSGDYETGGSSDNWDFVAAAYDAALQYRSKPSVLSAENLPQFLWAQHMDRASGLMQKEAFGHYTDAHFYPALVCWWLAPHFIAKGVPGWKDLDAELAAWLRCVLAWCAAAGEDHHARNSTDTDNKPGPRIIHGTGTPIDHCISTAHGQRGTVFSDGAWIYHISRDTSKINAYWGRGDRGFSYGGIQKLIPVAKNRGIYREVFLPREQEIVRKAATGDPYALSWLVHEINAWAPPKQPFGIIRAEGGTTFYMLKSPGSSTCSIYGTTTYPDGRTLVAVADPGYRSSTTNPGGVKAGTAVLDLNARTLTAQRDDKSLPAVVLPVAPGKILWHAQSTFATGLLILSSEGTTTPIPPPTVPSPPMGRAAAADWLTSASGRYGCSSVGYYSAILAVRNQPTLFVLVKEGDATPWDYELLWIKPDGSIAILSEYTCDSATGEILNYSHFFNAKGEPGYPWLPAEINREKPEQYIFNGYVIEYRVKDGPGQYVPAGSPAPLQPGQSRQRKAVAEVLIEHVGVLNHLPVPVAVVRRTDTMGQPPLANVEVYDIGYCDLGALGYIAHQSFEQGRAVLSNRATTIQPHDAPFRFKAMGPDGIERWYATSGYNLVLPTVETVATRPTVTSSGSSRNWFDKLLDFLKGLFD